MDCVHCLKVTAGEKPCQSCWLTQCAVACRCSDQPVGLHACRQPSHDGDIADASHGPFVASSAPAAMHNGLTSQASFLLYTEQLALISRSVCACLAAQSLERETCSMLCCQDMCCLCCALHLLLDCKTYERAHLECNAVATVSWLYGRLKKQS